MPDFSRTTRRLGGGPGLALWQTRSELVESRNRQLLPVVILAALVSLMCVLWLADDSPTDSATTGFIALEVIALVPLVFGARRVVRLTRLLNRVDTLSADDQAVEVEALRATDESVWRVGRLVASLSPGPIQQAAREAARGAERARDALRPLIHRRTQLEHLIAVTKSRSATVSLSQALAGCAEDITRIEVTLDDLAASVASLIDAGSEAAIEIELSHVRDATERLAALASAMREVHATEVGPGPDARPTTSRIP